MAFRRSPVRSRSGPPAEKKASGGGRDPGRPTCFRRANRRRPDEAVHQRSAANAGERASSPHRALNPAHIVMRHPRSSTSHTALPRTSCQVDEDTATEVDQLPLRVPPTPREPAAMQARSALSHHERLPSAFLRPPEYGRRRRHDDGPLLAPAPRHLGRAPQPRIAGEVARSRDDPPGRCGHAPEHIRDRGPFCQGDGLACRCDGTSSVRRFHSSNVKRTHRAGTAVAALLGRRRAPPLDHLGDRDVAVGHV